MVILAAGFDNQVIDVVFDLFSHHVIEYCGRCSLICCSCILTTKWHYSVVEVAEESAEGCLLSVSGRDFDLIVAAETIHEGKHSMASNRVNEHTHVRQREFILWTCFVRSQKMT